MHAYSLYTFSILVSGRLLELAHDLDDHVDAHRLPPVPRARGQARGADVTQRLQRLLREQQCLLGPAAVQQPARHGVRLDRLLPPRQESMA